MIGVLDWVAIAWVASSAVGMLIAGIGVREGWRDWRALDATANGRRDLAFDYLRTQAGRVVISLVWFAPAVPLLVDDRDTPLTVFTAVLVFGNALLAVMAAASLRTRRRLIARYAR